MGAKQSKRSVDISGKEAESAGEVAAAGAAGEGRVEALADADALKPQLNGDVHIHDQDKEKQLDSGTPENEKDATTEKDNKESENESDKEKEAAPVSNGDTEPKGENGDSPAQEEGKKPKKEKVKKKWSLRSISFSRKDKPKQEKKQKEEEPKTNGEPEKVPEEAAEVTPENAANAVAEEVKPEPPKEEKTPETPVTEPLTNGSSTPESTKAESPAAEESPAPAAASPEVDRHEAKPEVQPEQLPVNGLSLEEPKTEASEAQNKESKPEESAADTTEPAPAPEIPVKKEVCVEQMPLESTPPPLPANPPPSSVVSFAATTMAPELTDASLANTADLVSSPPTAPDTEVGKVTDVTLEASASSTNLDLESTISNDTVTSESITTELSPPFKESSDLNLAKQVTEIETEQPVIEKALQSEIEKVESDGQAKLEAQSVVSDVIKPEQGLDSAQSDENLIENGQSEIDIVLLESQHIPPETQEKETEIAKVQTQEDGNQCELPQPVSTEINNVMNTESNLENNGLHENTITELNTLANEILDAKDDYSPEIEMIAAPESDSKLVEDTLENIEDLPPPPPADEDIQVLTAVTEQNIEIAQERNDALPETISNVNSNIDNIDFDSVNTGQLNGNIDTEQENLKNKSKDILGNVIETVECNGNLEEKSTKMKTTHVLTTAENDVQGSGKASPEEWMPPSLSEASETLPAGAGSEEASEAFPPPPADLCAALDHCAAAPADTLQESIPVSDKLADLIPEVPVVPELNTETLQETSTDVAIAN